ncbi:hypothetical protein HKX48_003090 [Thoreauomyces humboldtii]|nr:hypothetical protein HKX48_003090 [Thoreauomyces humboldtii]
MKQGVFFRVLTSRTSLRVVEKRIPIATTLSHIFTNAILTILDAPSRLASAGSLKERSVCEAMAQYATGTLLRFVQKLVNLLRGTVQYDLEQRLQVLEDVVAVMFKALSHSDREGAHAEVNPFSTLQLALYSSLVHLLPATFMHKPSDSLDSAVTNHIRFLSHPLLLVRHCTMPVLRMCIWSSEHASTGARVLLEIKQYLLQWAADETPDAWKGTDLRELRRIMKHVATLLDLLAGAIVVAPRTRSSSKMKPIVVSDGVATTLLEWARAARGTGTRAVHLLLVPVLEQCLGVEANWESGEKIIAGLCGAELGRSIGLASAPTHSQSPFSSTPHWLTRWLIVTACWRHDVRSAGTTDLRKSRFSASITYPEPIRDVKVGKLPDNETETVLRLFCIRLLGMARTENRQITMCLLSLFDDTSHRVRRTVAQAIAYRCLNNLHRDISASAHPAFPSVRHRRRGRCTSGSNTIQQPTNPFAYIVRCAHDACSSFNEDGNVTPAATQRERETFELWAAAAARHVFGSCPLFGVEEARTVLVELVELLDGLMKVDVESDRHGASGIVTSIVDGVLSVWRDDDLTTSLGTADAIEASTSILTALRKVADMEVRKWCLIMCRDLLKGKLAATSVLFPETT